MLAWLTGKNINNILQVRTHVHMCILGLTITPTQTQRKHNATIVIITFLHTPVETRLRHCEVFIYMIFQSTKAELFTPMTNSEYQTNKHSLVFLFPTAKTTRRLLSTFRHIPKSGYRQICHERPLILPPSPITIFNPLSAHATITSLYSLYRTSSSLSF